MNPFRGLFNSSARMAQGLMPDGTGMGVSEDIQAMQGNPAIEGIVPGRRMTPQDGGSTILRGDPNGDTIIDRQMGAGTVARLPPTMGEAPPRTGPNRWETIGATMQDVGAAFQGGQGGHLTAVQEAYRERSQRAKEEAQAAEMERLGQDLYGDDPEALALYRVAPEKALAARIEARQPKQPVLVNTRLGPRLYHPDSGRYEKLEDIPERLPPGYIHDEQGNVQLDPNYLAGQVRLADGRAAATARHRAPRSPGGSGGGGGGASPSSGGTPPWQRKW